MSGQLLKYLDAQWPGEKRASLFWLVDFLGQPLPQKHGAKATTGQLEIRIPFQGLGGKLTIDFDCSI